MLRLRKTDVKAEDRHVILPVFTCPNFPRSRLFTVSCFLPAMVFVFRYIAPNKLNTNSAFCLSSRAKRSKVIFQTLNSIWATIYFGENSIGNQYTYMFMNLYTVAKLVSVTSTCCFKASEFYISGVL